MTHFQKKLAVGAGIIGAAVLLCGIGFFFFVKDIQTQSEAIALSRALLTRQSELISLLAELKRNSAELDSYQKKIDTLLPSKEQLLGISQAFESSARTHQVAMDFRFEGEAFPSSAAQPGYNAFTLNLLGGYENLLAFLEAIELRSPQFLITLEGLDITRAGNNYQVISQGRAYFR